MTEDQIQDARRARLIGLVEHMGGPAKVGHDYGLTRSWESQYAQIKAGGSFGSRAARNLEEKLRLPSRFFDAFDQPAPGSWGDAADLQQTVNSVQRVISLPASTNEPTDVVICQYDTGGAMGHGVVLQEQPGIIKEWRVSEEWLRLNVHRVTSHKNLAIVTGFGDSMKGMYNPGDPLLVDRGVRVVDFDAVYFFRVGSEGFVKRLQRIPGEGILAISENKAYRDWTIKPDMDFEVFARVVKVWRGEEF